MEERLDLSAWPSLELPQFDVDAPFSILDRISGVPQSRDEEVSSTKQKKKLIDQKPGVSIDDLTSLQDGVLDRFILGESESTTLESETLETYNPLSLGEDKTSALSQWPRSVEELEGGLAEDIDGNILLPKDFLNFQSKGQKSNNSYLIKPILPSDFDEQTDSISDCDSSSNESSCILKEKNKAWSTHFKYGQTLLPSLFQAAQGHSSDHFLWSDDLMIFNSRDMKNSRLSGKEIFGITPTSANSIEERFLGIGALQRRLQWTIERICSSNKFNETSITPSELYTLASGLSDILDYVNLRLRSYEGKIEIDGTLDIWTGLADIESLLQGLCQMMKCGMEQSPPFPPVLESTSSSVTKVSAQVLSLVYANLVASLSSCAPPNQIGAFEYLLHLTTTTWRKRVANWIGWPCFDKDHMSDEVDMRMQMGREEQLTDRDIQMNMQNTKSNRCEPWSGMEVEWSWDDRGELDVGYTLRPVRLPSFVPIATARDLLEAGRALRLLKRAAPEGHPLLLLHDRSNDLRQYGYKLPDWQENRGGISVHHLIRDLRREIAAWRRYRVQNGETSVEKGHKIIGLTKSILPKTSISLDQQGKPFYDNLTGESLVETLAHFSGSPKMGEPDGIEPFEDEENGNNDGTVLAFIESRQPLRMQDIPQSVNEKTSSNLLSPMVHWSRLINESLISVFFRDLHLGEYLDVCRYFLLLGNQAFASRISEILFHDGSIKAQDTTDSLVEGSGLSKLLLNDTTWPPGGSELPMALNAVVLESIANSRMLRTAKKWNASNVKTGHGRGAEQALLDLDDRLSFSIVKPEKKMTGWHNRQSIEALDWLSISFQPPPLIAPLITLQTQISYQRLFRHLLRLMRVDSVLKDIFRRLMSRSQMMNEVPNWMDEGDLECASRLRFEASHFVSVLYNHTCDMMISHRWKVFRNRLDSLCRSAESQDDAMTDMMDHSLNQSSALEETEDGMSFTDNMSEFDGGTAEAQIDGSEAGIDGNEGSLPKYQTELKDVFSIAAYHERTLDRMLSGCFLKTRQNAIMSIIVDMFNLILAFGQVLRPQKEEDAIEPKMFSDASRSTNIADGMEASKTLFNLLTCFQSKMRLLLHALELVGQRAMNQEGEGGKFGNLSLHRLRLSNEPKKSLKQDTSSSFSNTRSKKKVNAFDARHAAIEAEIARQEAEMRRDLEQLELTERKEGFGDLEVLQALVLALRGK